MEAINDDLNMPVAMSVVWDVVKNTKKSGTVILNGDDKILMEHKGEIAQKVVTVGIKNIAADIVAKNIVSTKTDVSFTARACGKEFDITLPTPGEHNVINALFSSNNFLNFLL